MHADDFLVQLAPLWNNGHACGAVVI